MEADFSGYATKAGLKCTDGRTIMPGAFRHQDQVKVPLVWQHGHTDPENVLGHALLEDRPDGTYAYGFFNKSAKAEHAHGLLEHGDISQLSIWANQLVERAGKVLHGAIREVSLVLAGANPGAVIENVTIRHADGDPMMLDDEAIIYTGLELEHQSLPDEESNKSDENDEKISHAEDSTDDPDDDSTVQDVYDSMTDQQKQVLHYMLGEALEAAKSELKQDNLGDAEDTQDHQKGTEMTHNVFEARDKKSGSLLSNEGYTLSHDDMKGIVSDALKMGSLREAAEQFVLSHGIDNIDVLFPDARALDSTPEYLKRRTEWVSGVLSGVRKSPFARIKTLSADITMDEARAKGYVTGDLKKEEFFGVSKRVTTPTTVYKKQKLDRDDMVDITDFDVVAWLKGEMRLMLDEEIARAILIGDGRDVSNEDKINEQNIRPIAKDHSLFTTVVTVEYDAGTTSVRNIIDALILNRRFYKGSGLPTMFTTETVISQFMLLVDGMERRLYRSLDELASELRVAAIVPVEVMEEDPTVVAVLVNLNDYVVGADKGGNVSLFDDFDIDYNQYKYLIEGRLSGALVKMKSAIVVKTVPTSAAPVVPNDPTFDGTTVTIVATTNVTYKDADTGATLTGAVAVAEGESLSVIAVANTGYYINPDVESDWTFYNRA